MTDDNFVEMLSQTLAAFGIDPLTVLQYRQLKQHYEMMLRWNRRLNLTRITDLKEAVRLHYAESLLGGRLLGSAKRVLDIGSGAGFPAVPLAVLRSDLAVTALESNSKKATFLKEVKETLNLGNMTIEEARIEGFDCGSYDLLVSRALDRASELIPSVAKELKPHQRLMIFCGSDLVDAIKGVLGEPSLLELLAIPESKSRFIVLFGTK